MKKLLLFTLAFSAFFAVAAAGKSEAVKNEKAPVKKVKKVSFILSHFATFVGYIYVLYCSIIFRHILSFFVERFLSHYDAKYSKIAYFMIYCVTNLKLQVSQKIGG